MEKRFLRLNDISAYKISFELSNYILGVVSKWDISARRTVGDQFIRAVDSISSNIAEGFGRYHKKDKIHFYHISYGSINECLDWNEKAKIRKLLKDDEYEHIFRELKTLPREINSLIQFTNQKLSI
ncbi:MAG: four helix bundle protein [Candidatus Nealsonbacteria bacterium CG_4_10_14_0_2_um_filter_38_17]|uniref:Four helix bundle protein n=1 Tax=Candidatus Nealsonbacteria bacterium CG_4_10_14_0_2_um_filter_38_17 TaxID=1974680 RepID=A0A2M7UYU8_9BACT|nr:MAG: four helix bundle protein [Candidatus Nealsonbacteria bacterium CG_4_10_14_0_2_um_filter_38_17]